MKKMSSGIDLLVAPAIVVLSVGLVCAAPGHSKEPRDRIGISVDAGYYYPVCTKSCGNFLFGNPSGVKIRDPWGWGAGAAFVLNSMDKLEWSIRSEYQELRGKPSESISYGSTREEGILHDVWFDPPPRYSITNTKELLKIITVIAVTEKYSPSEVFPFRVGVGIGTSIVSESISGILVEDSSGEQRYEEAHDGGVAIHTEVTLGRRWHLGKGLYLECDTGLRLLSGVSIIIRDDALFPGFLLCTVRLGTGIYYLF